MKTLELAIERMASRDTPAKSGGLTQLAERLGVTVQAVSGWRRRGVSHHMRPAVAKIAGTTVERGEW